MEKNDYKTTRHSSKRGLFTYLEQSLPFQKMFMDGIPVRYIPRILFMLLLGLIYVANSHYHEKMIRKINSLEQEVGGLKVNFIALKADYMLDSKQSSISERAATLGLYEVSNPPFKIKLPQ